jgi:predicted negative regulator of RcsB-dependent stress response
MGASRRSGFVPARSAGEGAHFRAPGAAVLAVMLAALLGLPGRLPAQAPSPKDRKPPSKKAVAPKEEPAKAPARPPYQWWSRSYAGRRALSFEKEPLKGSVVLLVFGTGGLTRPDGHDLRLIADHRLQLPVEVLEVGPGDRAALQFEMPEAGHELTLYLGCPTAEPPHRPARELKGGLRMELRALPEGSAGSLAEMQKLLKAAGEPVAVLFPDSIDLGVEPLGRRDYLARYVGYLEVAKPGEHLFETVSEGASFCRVDGKPVCEWPGFHDLSGHADPKSRKAHSGTVLLTPGIHQVEYLLATRRGGVHLLGLRGASDAFAHPIPAERFVRWARARPGPLEAYREPAADFAVRPLSDSGSDLDRHQLALLEFQWDGDLAGRELEEVEWEFGDGQTGRGKEVRHLFLGHGIFQVTARAALSGGKSLSATRRVAARFESLRVQDLNRLLDEYYQAAKGYEISSLSEDHLAQLIWLSKKDEAWEETLAHAVDGYFLRGFSLAREHLVHDGLRRARKLLEKREGYDGAEAILERVVRDAPKVEDRREAEAWLARSRMLRSDSKRSDEEAEKALRRIRQEGGQSDPARRAAIFLADLLLQKGKLEEAEKLLREMEEGAYRKFEGERQLASGSHALGFDNHLRRGELREAREELDRWDWELPGDRLAGHIQLRRAALYRKEKKYDDALRELEQVRSLGSAQNQVPRALLLSAEILLERGDRPAARAQLERVARDFAQRPESKEAERRLKEL